MSRGSKQDPAISFILEEEFSQLGPDDEIARSWPTTKLLIDQQDLNAMLSKAIHN